MPSKKISRNRKNRRLKAALISLAALLILGGGYHYLADAALKKADAYLYPALRINDLRIEKSYAVGGAGTVPLLLIEYSTDFDVDSYVAIGGQKLETMNGKEFSYDIPLTENKFGDVVNITIAAEGNGRKTEVKRAVALPKEFEPEISIT